MQNGVHCIHKGDGVLYRIYVGARPSFLSAAAPKQWYF